MATTNSPRQILRGEDIFWHIALHPYHLIDAQPRPALPKIQSASEPVVWTMRWQVFECGRPMTSQKQRKVRMRPSTGGFGSITPGNETGAKRLGSSKSELCTMTGLNRLAVKSLLCCFCSVLVPTQASLQVSGILGSRFGVRERGENRGGGGVAASPAIPLRDAAWAVGNAATGQRNARPAWATASTRDLRHALWPRRAFAQELGGWLGGLGIDSEG
ncbi:hypothetical protein BDW02DRAFT_178825 [Decorospora gaudefroyi]|uniref:Uncharacterized protein n=1 Tax=Decorospora gaudefroyi TaxID=184978 RepID=A0A6A5K4H5_9PLEO|nr:hypothetical protein BDW02DRAFT_178825 [Decorospora gaudefroyi]